MRCHRFVVATAMIFGLCSSSSRLSAREWTDATGKNTQHSMVALMRQSIFSRLAGYEDTIDAEQQGMFIARKCLVDEPARSALSWQINRR